MPSAPGSSRTCSACRSSGRRSCRSGSRGWPRSSGRRRASRLSSTSRPRPPSRARRPSTIRPRCPQSIRSTPEPPRRTRSSAHCARRSSRRSSPCARRGSRGCRTSTSESATASAATSPAIPSRETISSRPATIRLPVHRARWRAHEAERRALLRQTRARLRQHELSLEERLHAAHAELVRSDREAELLRTGLVPQAHQSLEASRSAYEVGRIELASLLDSQVRLLEAQLRAVRARASRRTAFARLEALVGEDLR